jgi:regulator of extracellular matrix RemA (YlzA/DUF370 family)
MTAPLDDGNRVAGERAIAIVAEESSADARARFALVRLRAVLILKALVRG